MPQFTIKHLLILTLLVAIELTLYRTTPHGVGLLIQLPSLACGIAYLAIVFGYISLKKIVVSATGRLHVEK